jgi:hypothetical protein
MSILKLDTVRGVMYLRSAVNNTVVIPLDAVQSVWQDDSRPEFQVAIKGALVAEGGQHRFFPT